MQAILLLSVVVVTSNGASIPLSKSHVSRFSCGKLHYRVFLLDERQDALLVGSMDRIFKLPTDDINRTRCDEDSLTLAPDNVQNCVSMGNSEQYECRNHIKVIQPMEGDRLYVCGTNAKKPKDWVLHANLSRVQNTVSGIGNAAGKCAFSPDDNATAVWVESGNPGNLPGLYSGTTADFQKSDRVIFRAELYDQETHQKKFDYMRTIQYNTKWLDKPDFVGSFEIGEYVYFFFRESAMETINSGKAVYSRVARICKRDTGGRHVLSKTWTTFLKARLNCSIPGEYPFYFNEIQSIYKIPGDDGMFYAVFTTQMNGIYGSAVCAFSLDSINEVFNGKFKKQENWSSAWLPVASSKVPTHRPGTCGNDTRALPDSVLLFSRDHTLMDSAVRLSGGRPIYHQADVVYTTITVHRQKVEGDEYTIIYVGSRDGHIFKIVHGNITGKPFANLVDTMRVAKSERIHALEISPERGALFAASDSGVVQVDLVMCRSRYSTRKRCIRDPYCGWNLERLKCRRYSEATGGRCRGRAKCLKTVAGE